MENIEKLVNTSFCPVPFCHLNIKHKGVVSACWKSPNKMGDYTTTTLKDIWNCENLKILRFQLLNGEQPKECDSCWDFENKGIDSVRVHSLNKYKTYSSFDMVRIDIKDDFSMPLEYIQSIEIRFDNTCNLMCRHCGPNYSSKWEQAINSNQQLSNTMKKYGNVSKTDNKKLTKDMINEIAVLAPSLKEIVIQGGEPLRNIKQYEFLESIAHTANNIIIKCSTNLTTLTCGKYNILDFWKHFKKINLLVSLDGDHSCYSYVRVNSDLNIVEKNIKEVMTLSNVKITCECTVSLLNITRFINIIEYTLSLGVFYAAGIVQSPLPLNIKLLPLHLKKEITKNWDEWKDNIDSNIDKHLKINLHKKHEYKINIIKLGNYVINFMNSEDKSNKWSEFIDYSSALDKFHGTNLFEIYPEYRKL